MNASVFLNFIASQGRHYFTAQEMMDSLEVSKQNAWAAIIRLEKKGLIATPQRGFHLILPPEYQRLGGLATRTVYS